MPQYSIKLCTYDPTIIDAFERLRKNRKQAAFTHEAIKQYLSTERGKQVLAIMEGSASGQQLPVFISSGVVTSAHKSPYERIVAKNASGFAPNVDCSDILSSILE